MLPEQFLWQQVTFDKGQGWQRSRRGGVVGREDVVHTVCRMSRDPRGRLEFDIQRPFSVYTEDGQGSGCKGRWVISAWVSLMGPVPHSSSARGMGLGCLRFAPSRTLARGTLPRRVLPQRLVGGLDKKPFTKLLALSDCSVSVGCLPLTVSKVGSWGGGGIYSSVALLGGIQQSPGQDLGKNSTV